MRRGAAVGLLVAGLVFAACGSSERPTEEEVVDALGVQVEGGIFEGLGLNGGQPTAIEGCSVEEIVIGEDQVAEYLSAAPDTVVANDDETAAVQYPSSNPPECRDQLADALNDAGG